MYPTISIALQGLKLNLLPEHYFETIFVTKLRSYQCFGMMDGGETSLTILGDTFMKGNSTWYNFISKLAAFYTIFDRENKRVGFVGAPGTLEIVPPKPKQTGLPYWAYVGIIVVSTSVGILLVISVLMSIYYYRSKKYEGYEVVAVVN